MILGVVGSEAKKFTPIGEARARNSIICLMDEHKPDLVVSGGCHLGGIDSWAVIEADYRGIRWKEFVPFDFNWPAYKARNEQIAKLCDMVVCITVQQLPPGFKEGGWERYCYHCQTDEHIKSGGCWTMKYAKNNGKEGRLVVVNNDP